MEFGIFSPFNVRLGHSEHEAFEEWIHLAEIADDLGMNCFWLAEFHFRPQTPLSAPLVVGSAVAARTKQINIGMGVHLLPLGNPLRLAEECATLDHLSCGRLVYGIGRSSFIDSYRGYGVDYEESRQRFSEALEVIRLAWGDAPFSFEGEFYQYHDVNVVPKPFQRPHPPIRIACESRASFPIMGRLGFPILMRHQMEIPELQQLLKQYEEERHAEGFDGPNQVTLQANCYLAESREQVRADAEESTMLDRRIARARQAGNEGDVEAAIRLGRLRDEAPFEELTKRYLYGTPDEIVDRLQEYQATLGITGVSLNMNLGGQIPFDRVVNSMRLLMERVAPRLN